MQEVQTAGVEPSVSGAIPGEGSGNSPPQQAEGWRRGGSSVPAAIPGSGDGGSGEVSRIAPGRAPRCRPRTPSEPQGEPTGRIQRRSAGASSGQSRALRGTRARTLAARQAEADRSEAQEGLRYFDRSVRGDARRAGRGLCDLRGARAGHSKWDLDSLGRRSLPRDRSDQRPALFAVQSDDRLRQAQPDDSASSDCVFEALLTYLASDTAP